MIINLSEVIKDIDAKIILDNDIDIQNAEFMGENFVFTKPLHINGSITNNTKSLELSGKVTGEMEVQCARCRKPMKVPVEFTVLEVIMQDNGEVDNEDIIVITGEEIDVNDIILNSFLMNVEGKYLCSEDCKGLCSRCGKDLNLGDCGCDEDNIDPRWAKLAEIMKGLPDTK